MSKYILQTHHHDSSVIPIELSGGTHPLDALNAAWHYVDTGQAVYVEVLSVGFTGVARLLGTAGSKPNV